MGSGSRYPLLNYTDAITSDYKLDQIQLIIRHGTRYPVQSATRAIHDSILLLKQSTNESLMGWVTTYHNTFTPNRAGQLTSWGQQELYTLGRNVADNYPDFVHKLVEDDIIQSFTAYSSYSERSAQSGSAFCIGLFKGLGDLAPPAKLVGVPIMTLPKNNDPLIAPHKACPRWQAEVGNTDIVNQHLRPYELKYLSPIAARLSQELQLELTMKDIKKFFSACVSEMAVHKRYDTFCSLFTKQDILALEYIDDAKHYFKYSYGLDINKDIACELGKNILQNIDNRLLKLDVKFGHTETTLPLRTLLGLYKDNFNIEMTLEEANKRQFKMSDFGTFVNNMAFQVISKQDKKFVRVLDNQQPIIIPGCDAQICDLNTFRQFMETRLECNFTRLCF
ncbi:phosphoglycerate mutase-like protein [Backusella circina FSU 941]|nr:phosphoglycerate mutase-like protein [Backusella circina FSU 941]